MMRSPIPKEMREQLTADPFMKTCALQGLGCEGRIEWHHAVSYAGKRINELWSIIPLCQYHHRTVGKLTFQVYKVVKERIKHFGADIKEKYPKLRL